MKMLRTPFLLLPVLLLTLVAGRRAEALAVPGPCEDGLLPSGALSRVCVPTFGWNGQLVVFAHGYVAFNQPIGFYHLELPDGTNIPTLVQTLGFAFATTSYRQNGLAILEGVEDIRELIAAFKAAAPLDPRRTYVTGVSEGGIIAALLAERFPDMFTGALATCGPIGSFRGQVNYVGDFRVLFDYYFPGVIPGSPTSIPPEVIDTWNTVYQPARPRCHRGQSPGGAGTAPGRARAFREHGSDDDRAERCGRALVQHLRHQRREREAGRQPLRQPLPLVFRVVR